VTAHRQLHPARGAGRRTELLTTSATTSCTRSRHQRRHRGGRDHLPVPVPPSTPTRKHVSSNNTGPITSLTSSSWNVRQFYSVTRITRGHCGSARQEARLARRSTSACAPHRITAHWRRRAVHSLDGGWVLRGPAAARASTSTWGSIFDLGVLRPFQNAHSHSPARGRRRRFDQANSTFTRSRCRSPRTHLATNGAMPTDPTKRRLGHRCLHHGQPAQVDGARERRSHDGHRSRVQVSAPRHAPW